MPENSSDPEYLDKKFAEAKNRYRQMGVGGVLIETDKHKDLEPQKPDAEFKNASRRFKKVKGNVVTMGDAKIIKTRPESSTKTFGIHKPTQGEK